jgi:hypothetical protein
LGAELVPPPNRLGGRGGVLHHIVASPDDRDGYVDGGEAPLFLPKRREISLP